MPLVVNHGLMLIRVRPGAEPGAPAEVSTTPADPSFVIHNGAVTKAKRRSRVTVRLSVNGSRIQIDVAGHVSAERGGIVFRRRVPHQALYAAALMRASLQTAGITVRDDARVAPTPPQKSGRALPLLALHEVGAARHPAAQDQQGLRQRLRRARAGGRGRRGLRRRADR